MSAEPVSKAFAALGDPIRRALVERLTEGDATVGELAEPFDVSLQAVSKHIKILERAGVVRRADTGHRSLVQLDAEVFDLMAKWIERYRREAEHRYRRLDHLLATDREAITTATHRETKSPRRTT
jgi:DNA-binding transcriptional ArsR family regulator